MGELRMTFFYLINLFKQDDMSYNRDTYTVVRMKKLNIATQLVVFVSREVRRPYDDNCSSKNCYAHTYSVCDHGCSCAADRYQQARRFYAPFIFLVLTC